VQANRVTLAGRQLRLGTDGRWYPYAKVDGRWQPDGEPIDGPVDGPGDDGPDGGGGDPVGGDPVGGDRPERGRRAD
jgi:hypothetical protein